MPYKDLGKARESADRERYRRLTEERLVQGLCPKCGRESLPPDRRLCHSCGEKKRKAERVRYARAKAEGRLYGGRDPKSRRRIGRERSRKRFRAHRDAGLCTRCGHHPPVQGGTTCRVCRDARQAAERKQYAARRAEGLCGRCGRPSFEGASRCGPCATIEARRHSKKNAAGREALHLKGGRDGVARTAANPRRELRGACRARTGPGCARVITGAFRSFRLGTP